MYFYSRFTLKQTPQISKDVLRIIPLLFCGEAKAENHCSKVKMIYSQYLPSGKTVGPGSWSHLRCRILTTELENPGVSGEGGDTL